MGSLKQIFFYLFAIVVGLTCVKSQDPKCLLPMDPGPCRMNLERYYFNSKTQKCETFKFGGCRGNDNKFGFRTTCEELCLRPRSAAVAKGAATATRLAENTTPKSAATSVTNKPIKKFVNTDT